MKNKSVTNNEKYLFEGITDHELARINGGDDGDIAYVAGYSYVFTLAHIFTFGLSTYAYLLKKAIS